MSGERLAFHHPRVRPAWLAMLREEILDPAQIIIDPHHHLWPARPDPYLLADLVQDTRGGHDVRATVFIQCGSAYRRDGPEAMRPIGETEFVAAIVAEGASEGAAGGAASGFAAAAGIVGFADCLLGDAIEPVLRAHETAGMIGGAGHFKGIRHSATYDPGIAPTAPPGAPPGLFLDPMFRRGVARTGQLGFTFEAWCYHPQLPELADLLRACPDQKIVLNHLGGPLGVGPYESRRDAVFAQWAGSMRELAAFPNLSVKLGGLAMNVNGFGFHHQALPPGSGEMASAWRPYMETAIEAFGAARCMFESNFPVDKGMCAYSVLWNAFKRIAQGCTAGEKADLFHRTAARFYALAEPA